MAEGTRCEIMKGSSKGRRESSEAVQTQQASNTNVSQSFNAQRNSMDTQLDMTEQSNAYPNNVQELNLDNLNVDLRVRDRGYIYKTQDRTVPQGVGVIAQSDQFHTHAP